MQGPMVGAVTPSEARLWMRTSGAFDVVVEYDTTASFATARQTDPVPASPEADYVVEVVLPNLAPGTRYHYRVRLDGRPDHYLGTLEPFAFRTAPPPGMPVRFRVGFGSCARYQSDPEQPIWDVARAADLDLFFWVGDNIYGDALDPAILVEEYRRQRTVPALLPLLRSVPQLATWDDHDYGLNDHDRTNPIKHEALAVFERYWANPGYGLPDAPGTFFRYPYGGVDFFFLDARFYRDPNAAPDGPGKTMLGDVQLAWLQDELRQSTAPFKVLISGSGWSRAKGPGGDSWAAFLHERDALFDFIRDEAIPGVVLLSGDTHVAELNAIPWSERGGYDFYDLVSSPLAQRTTDSWLERRPEIRIRPVYFNSPNVGVLTVDLTDRPTLTFTVLGLDGRPAWAPFVLHADELTNGTTSWPDKIDPESRRRLEQAREGRGVLQSGAGALTLHRHFGRCIIATACLIHVAQIQP